ncbi:MAG TPA: Sec-independent protein translocase protein TatB [Caulobacteraceae bacterium]
MLPQIGATELILVAVLALIVVGPKDLPLMLRRLGQFIARMRNMASEFRASFDELATHAELDELRKEVAAMREGRYAAQFSDPDADKVFDEIDADLNQPLPSQAPPPAEIEAKPKPKPKAKKKAAPKKTPAKKAPAKKAPAKKTAAKKAPAKKKPAPKKPRARKAEPKS